MGPECPRKPTSNDLKLFKLFFWFGQYVPLYYEHLNNFGSFPGWEKFIEEVNSRPESVGAREFPHIGAIGSLGFRLVGMDFKLDDDNKTLGEIDYLLRHSEGEQRLYHRFALQSHFMSEREQIAIAINKKRNDMLEETASWVLMKCGDISQGSIGHLTCNLVIGFEALAKVKVDASRNHDAVVHLKFTNGHEMSSLMTQGDKH